MKKLFFSLTAFLFIFSISNAQIKVATSGTVSIGSTSDATETLEVNGTASISGNADFNGISDFNNTINTKNIIPITDGVSFLGNGMHYYSHAFANTIHSVIVYQSSDAKLKENVRPLANSLVNVLELKPVVFDYKANLYSDYPEALREVSLARRKDNTGFIAQDVQKVFPRLVELNEEADYLEINYIGVIPELVKAIQEQQLIIESLQSQLSSINTLLVKESNLKSIASVGEDNLQVDEIILYQNSPNPFSQETKIKYKIPTTTNNAIIIIHDMTGKQLNSYELHETGESSINIYSGELTAGMYMYSLLVDGSIIDTKQMIITE